MLKDIELEKIISFLNRKPNVLETAMFDTMWSEHCSYKSTKHWFKLFKDITSPRVKLGMGEGAGLIDVGDGQIIGFKMESHNHPSAIDPFNGAATGVGGIIRDILSQGCQPIALLDSLRFGDLSDPHTQFLFENVVRGISSYGNCVGIPNIGGDIIFDSSYQRNCLVNVMCIGIVDESHIIHSKASKTGNKLVVFGSRTGRDGIGGVSFASLDLTESSEKSRSSVQIGDPALEKVLIDVVQDLIFADLINGMQDLGGGGLTCAASEIVVAGEKGVIINIDKLPLREEGMHPWEIMISESQERMIVVVDEKKIGSVKEILEKHDVYYGIVGEVIDEDKIVITNNNKDILANLPASFLVNGFISFNHPQKPIEIDNLANYPKGASDSIIRNFTKLLSSVNIGSKEFIYSQYDKTVQSRTILEPGDNAGVLDIGHGKAIGAVMDTNDYQVSINPKIGTIKAILRCFGKLNATGLEPLAMVDCLNFGNPERPESYWQFVQAVEGLSEAASSLQLPVIGGNVSLYNENDSKVGSNRIHPTPSIGILGLTNNNQCICTQKVKFSNSYMFIIGNMNFSLKG
ncbi:MAG: phosphoribosylformylglycinamidine synthase subunit PurL, partial [Candidatus Thorarchaeota archaeon]